MYIETDINANAFLQRLVYYILNKDRETALSDALEVVKAYSHINEDSVYLFRLPYLIDHDRVSNIYVGSIMDTMSTVDICCKLSVIYYGIFYISTSVKSGPSKNHPFLRIMKFTEYGILEGLVTFCEVFTRK